MSGCSVRAVQTIMELREASGKSRAAVASDLSMSERHLYRLENGRPLRHVLILAFANYYGVKPDQIDPQAEKPEPAAPPRSGKRDGLQTEGV